MDADGVRWWSGAYLGLVDDVMFLGVKFLDLCICLCILAGLEDGNDSALFQE